jgi:hypothetical protein
LISIGYGLGDSRINEYIIDNFLIEPNNKMIVIAPHKPDSKLFDYKNVKYFGKDKGVEQINKKEIDKIFNE